tara:strand:- start:295 stop:687 length:393 start_codon:yes stop_codon:yes gene_type:complete
MNNTRIIGKPFKKGEDHRRNTTGKNKGATWNKTLLNNLLNVQPVINNNESLNHLVKKFPALFNSNEDKNLQLLIELKQISLIFSDNEAISQKAIIEVKDRIQGKTTAITEIIQTEIKPLTFKIIGSEDVC